MNQRHLWAPSESDSVGVSPRFVQMNEDGTIFTSGWKRPMIEASSIPSEVSSNGRERLEAYIHISQKDSMRGFISMPLVFCLLIIKCTWPTHDILFKMQNGTK